MPALKMVGFVVVSLVAFVACSGTSNPPSAPAAPVASQSPQATVVSTAKTSLGTLLVGQDGLTLYLFEADTTSKSTCSDSCAQTWLPLLTTGAPVAGAGVKQALLSTTERGDGSRQVTYNGHPLYHFAGDTKAGDTSGEGLNCFGAGWDVVSPAGIKIEKGGG
jgi:predicted lipoprotein with Yx(FWY)xxD motif